MSHLTIPEKEALDAKLGQYKCFANHLKLENKGLTEERNELIVENMKLKRELHEIKSMGMFEFAEKYCNDKELEEAGHAFARSLGVGIK